MDVYVNSVLEKIKGFINKKEYMIAGEYFMDLCHYGIEIEYQVLVFLSSELGDIYRNSLLRIKEYGNESDFKLVEQIKSETFKLIEFMSDMPPNLDNQNIEKIFEMLKFIIYHGEKIQYELNKRQRARVLRKRRLGD